MLSTGFPSWKTMRARLRDVLLVIAGWPSSSGLSGTLAKIVSVPDFCARLIRLRSWLVLKSLRLPCSVTRSTSNNN